MEEKYETISWNNWDVNVLSVGGPTPSTISELASSESLILIGTGNPGICQLYRDFAASIHVNSGLPVWVVGLLGFDSGKPWKLKEITMDSQIAMKKAVIKNYLNGRKLIAVDHSTSCYITLNLLEDNDVSGQFSDIFFLMPVLCLPDGWMWKWTNYLMRTEVFRFGEKVLASADLMTLEWRRVLLSFVTKLFKVDRVPDVASYMNTNCLQVYLHTARDLFDKELDLRVLERFSNRINILSSYGDSLVHTEVQRFIQNLPQVRFTQKPHTFFFRSGIDCGLEISDWIKENRQSYKSHTEI